MRFKFIVFDKGKIFIILFFIISILILGYSIFDYRNVEKVNTVSNVETKEVRNISSNNVTIKQATENLENRIKSDKIEVAEYTFMPQYIQKFLVIGELKIPSINLDTYILNESSDKALNISVTKLSGPEINNKGNFCITGHNYLKDNMFGRLKKVNIGDQVTLIDTFGKSKDYKVYDKYEVDPNDTSVLKQDTDGKTEVTLITCTTGARKRVVVKAVAI